METGLGGKKISYEQIQAMKYLDQCVAETLRRYPPAMVKLCEHHLKR